MAEKVSLKIVIILSLICGILSACMNAVDVQTFLEDEKVQEIVAANKLAVIIDPTSDGYSGLRAGNRTISGLTPGKYYRLEEYDETKTFKGNLFVQADGDTWGDLSTIGPLTGNQIKNLTNDYTYKVKLVQPFADAAYEYFAISDTSTKTANVTAGKITIRGSGPYYLNVANTIVTTTINASKKYEVMKIPNTGWNATSRISANYTLAGTVSIINDTQYSGWETGKDIGIYQYRTAVSTGYGISLNGMSIIKLEAIDTTNDYIFAEYDDIDHPVTNFFVLKVERLDEISTITATITAVIGFTSEFIPDIDPVVGFSQSASTATFTLRVTNGSGYNFVWKDDQGVTKSTVNPAIINLNIASDVNWWQEGDHVITLEATRTADSTVYSGTIIVTCSMGP